VAIETETEHERSRRRHRRTLFDSVADLYEASRRGYPGHLVDFVVATAALGPTSRVLEVGCGTGQLTESLARFGFDLTAIDIGPSMIEAAKRRVGNSAVRFQVSSFEDFTGTEASFDLVISGTAFHWVDPEVQFSKPALLLRPGGWLALLSTGEHYDDPFGTTLRDMWMARREKNDAWSRQPKPTLTEIIADTGLFEPAVYREDERRLVLPVRAVVDVENTRATSLSWPDEARREFTEEMRRHLSSQTEVHLTQHTRLTMARAGT
jgi:2-polyprenyl-3-methyl-5-hydroxy-6-metoxy-1,4-benzoquinol methylase